MDVAEMTVGQWQARQIEKAAGFMCRFVESTQPDRLNWRPATEDASKTRSVMEQLNECIFANRRFICFLRGETPGEPVTYDSVEGATGALKASATELAGEIRNLKSEDLMQEIQTHRGAMPIALAIQFPLRNMLYHIGQINMIQLLYGDTEFHIDQEFVTL